MRSPRWLIVLLATLAVMAGARNAAAQFETPNRSFHNSTAFRLDGRHQVVPCSMCHINGQFAGTPKTCYECHWIRRKDDRFQTRLGTQCEQCHRPTTWSAVRFDHGGLAGVQLNADHRQLSCESCHKGADVRAGAVVCVTCHRKEYDATRTPPHAAAGFPTNCEGCHRPSDPVWQSLGGGGFSHAAVFPLVGVHATQACATCHKNNVYRGTPRDCVGCHQADYTRTQTPNHVAAGFPTTCDSCHRASDPQWRGAGFNHSQFFALVGMHATQTCTACHKNNVYKGTARDCVGCHLPNYNSAQSPNHVTAGFPTTCDSCHRATDPAWKGASFNHNQFFALVGVHATQACAVCHKNNVYKGTARDCVGCHLPNYNTAQNPNHVAAAFPTTCDTCHRATDPTWKGASFNHNQFFALQGVHASQACAVCHKNNVYRGTPRDCVGCHLTDYNNSRNPSHVAAGFPTTCDTCHRVTDTLWSQGRFTHTAFVLSGPHNVSCSQCHTTPNNFAVFSCTGCHDRTSTDGHHRGVGGYRYDSNACYSCHQR